METKMTFMSELKRLREENKQGDVCDGLAISAFLVNRAEAIEELVSAAEGAAEKIKTCDYVMARSDLLVALAKLEKP